MMKMLAVQLCERNEWLSSEILKLFAFFALVLVVLLLLGVFSGR